MRRHSKARARRLFDRLLPSATRRPPHTHMSTHTSHTHTAHSTLTAASPAGSACAPARTSHWRSAARRAPDRRRRPGRRAAPDPATERAPATATGCVADKRLREGAEMGKRTRRVDKQNQRQQSLTSAVIKLRLRWSGGGAAAAHFRMNLMYKHVRSPLHAWLHALKNNYCVPAGGTDAAALVGNYFTQLGR